MFKCIIIWLPVFFQYKDVPADDEVVSLNGIVPYFARPVRFFKIKLDKKPELHVPQQNLYKDWLY